MLPVATAAFAADWIVTPRVLEAEVHGSVGCEGEGTEDVDNQAGVGVNRCDGVEDGVPQGPTSRH